MRQNTDIAFDYNNMMSERIGEKTGISDSEISARAEFARQARSDVLNAAGKGMMGWTDLPYDQAQVIAEIKAAAKRIRENFEYFAVLGIGGSALGPNALFNALCHLRHNELCRPMRKAPKFYVEDNVDPERMRALLDVIDLEKTMFNVVTKSGATSETMTQYLVINKILTDRFGSDAARHIIVTTSASRGNLIKIAKAEGYEAFFIPEGVGGRFSVLCPVGLLPAAALGIDIDEFVSGARRMLDRCKAGDDRSDPALIAALLQRISIEKGRNISVMMPYSDRLRLIADWYAQLWGESLGKALATNGETVNAGQTPVKALGVTDQHSQIQLYVEGPFDKVITFVETSEYGETVEIPQGCADMPDVNFLCGHTMNELISSELSATEYALTEARRPNCKITLPKIDANAIGQLMMFFMMQTAYLGRMLNIDAFDQPGVEAGKRATYALLGRKGFESEAEKLRARKPKSAKYRI